MSTFLQVIAGTLLAALLGIALSRQGQDITLLLSLAVCCMILGVAISFLEPVMDFVDRLQDLGDLDPDMMEILWKAVGVGMLTEVAALICTDAGNGALGKTVQMLGSAVVLWVSLPLMTALLDLVQRIVGAE